MTTPATTMQDLEQWERLAAREPALRPDGLIFEFGRWANKEDRKPIPDRIMVAAFLAASLRWLIAVNRQTPERVLAACRELKGSESVDECFRKLTDAVLTQQGK